MRIKRISLSFVPVVTRVPLKFGDQTLTEVSCARVGIKVTDGEKEATGWAEKS